MYATLQDLQNRYGMPVLNKWADLEGDGSGVTNRIQVALQQADDEINLTLNGKWYQTPLTGMDAMTSRRVAQYAVVIAGYWLYFGTGLLSTDKQGGAMQKAYDDVRSVLLQIANHMLDLNGNPRWAPNPRTPWVMRDE